MLWWLSTIDIGLSVLAVITGALIVYVPSVRLWGRKRAWYFRIHLISAVSFWLVRIFLFYFFLVGFRLVLFYTNLNDVFVYMIAAIILIFVFFGGLLIRYGRFRGHVIKLLTKAHISFGLIGTVLSTISLWPFVVH